MILPSWSSCFSWIALLRSGTFKESTQGICMNNDFLVFGSPVIGEEEIAEVEACVRSGWLGTGPRVAKFEQDFALYQHISPTQVAAVNSCTAALHVSMVAAGLE